MLKIKSIVLFVSMLLFLGVCVQIYLLLQMGMFGFADMFFYGILFLTLSSIAIGVYKKTKTFAIASILFLTAFMSVKFAFNRIENYYFNKTISNGNIIKADLKKYYNAHKVFPERLNDLYKKSEAPQYNIGFLKYKFSYHKTDKSYRLYFSHFEGRMFVNYGESNIWDFYD